LVRVSGRAHTLKAKHWLPNRYSELARLRNYCAVRRNCAGFAHSQYRFYWETSDFSLAYTLRSMSEPGDRMRVTAGGN
jgi:hypothetical protein